MIYSRYFRNELFITFGIRLHLLVASERNEIRLRNSAEEIEITLRTSRILDNAESKSNPETSGSDEKCPDKQSRDDQEGTSYT